jgi:hypothetical protein
VIWQTFKKDWRLLWPMAALVTAIQIGLERAAFSAGLFGDDPAAGALLRPLTLAWFCGIAALCAAVVHQDALPGVDQDWLIRPVTRTRLFISKLCFVAVTIIVPMLVLNLWDALAAGFPVRSSLEAIVAKEAFVFVCFLIPVMSLASTTRSMAELVITAAALVVVFAVGISLSTLLLGSDWCPTCNSGLSWLQHLGQHVGILIGAAAILCLQYYGRRTAMARALAVIGTLCLVFAQLPWSAAFALQSWMADAADAGQSASAITLKLDNGAPAVAEAELPARADNMRQSIQLLMRGRVDQAAQNLRRGTRPDSAAVTTDAAIRVSGVSSDELLVADRAEFALLGGDGKSLYRGNTAGSLATRLTAYPGRSADWSGVAYQSIVVPDKILRALDSAAILQMRLSLTLLRAAAEYKLPALDGELRSPELGRCATEADKNAVYLRCTTIVEAPFCYSAALYAADGRHNPEVLKCTPDYRHGLPTFLNALNAYGVDLALQDHSGTVFDIDRSQLEESYVLIKLYRVRSHFTRELQTLATQGLAIDGGRYRD